MLNYKFKFSVRSFLLKPSHYLQLYMHIKTILRMTLGIYTFSR